MAKSGKLFLMLTSLLVLNLVSWGAPREVVRGEVLHLDFRGAVAPVVVRGGRVVVDHLPGDRDPFESITLESGRITFTRTCSSEGFTLPLQVATGDTLEFTGVDFTGDTLAVMTGGALLLDDGVVNMHRAGILADHPDLLELKDLTLSNSMSDALVRIDGGGAELRRLQFLTAATGLWLSPTASVTVDSCQFQGNGTAVHVVDGGDLVQFRWCDFVESTEMHLYNEA